MELQLFSFEKQRINGRYLATYTQVDSTDYVVKFEKYFDEVPPMKATISYLTQK